MADYESYFLAILAKSKGSSKQFDRVDLIGINASSGGTN